MGRRQPSTRFAVLGSVGCRRCFATSWPAHPLVWWKHFATSWPHPLVWGDALQLVGQFMGWSAAAQPPMLDLARILMEPILFIGSSCPLITAL